jgi:glyoxylase-like metal-dependent hydrolase (beta-lactamase superfamily II)
MALGDTRDNWQKIFDHYLDGKPVKAVLVTHMHPDHVGLAGWLCDKWRVPLYMSFGEYYSARSFAKMSAEDLGWTTEAYFRAAGMDATFYEAFKKGFRGYASVVEPMPGAFIRLEENDEIVIAGNKWRVIIGRGHSPEHVCLYCEQLSVLLSGDQVIPRITSNVSVMPAEPEGNPLAQWLHSLQKLKSLPADTLVLPAHNTPFRGLHTRLQFLIEHHQDHLLALEEACIEAKTAFELLPVLFARELDDSQVTLALGECVAHLNYLCQQGRLTRSQDAEGVNRFIANDPDLPARVGRASHHRDSGPIQV